MRILLIQNCATEDLGSYQFWLRSEGHECARVRVDEAQEMPPLDAWDAAILGGTPFPANSFCGDRRYRREWRYLRGALAARKPLLGICCGARVLARLLGARVHPLPRMEIGLAEVRLTAAGVADPLFDGFPRDFPAFEWHKDAFEIPPGAAWLASGDIDRFQAFRRGPSVGLAFHLEVGARAAGAWADAYPAELRAAGGHRQRMLRSLEEEDIAIRGHAFRLMRNFVKLVAASSGPEGPVLDTAASLAAIDGASEDRSRSVDEAPTYLAVTPSTNGPTHVASNGPANGATNGRAPGPWSSRRDL